MSQQVMVLVCNNMVTVPTKYDKHIYVDQSFQVQIHCEIAVRLTQ